MPPRHPRPAPSRVDETHGSPERISRRTNTRRQCEPTFRAASTRKRKAPQEDSPGNSYKERDNISTNDEIEIGDSTCQLHNNLVSEISARLGKRQKKGDSRIRELVHQLIEDVAKESAAFQGRIQDLESDIEHLKEQSWEQRHTGQVLDAGAESFLSVSISHSGSELKALVETLNYDIGQRCAAITELVCSGGSSDKDNSHQNSDGDFPPFPEFILASQLLQQLQRSGGQCGLVLFQRALQAMVSWACHRLINSWAGDETSSKALEGIYGNMRKGALPSVAGRWKILTRQYSNNASRATVGQVVNSLINDVFSLVELMPDSSMDPKLRKDIGRDMKSVLERAIQVDHALTGAASDEDWEVFCIRAGDKFDKRKMCTSMRSGSDETELVGLAVCSTGLGLRRTAIRKSKRNWEFVLKAKVLLEEEVKGL
ncbi:hypothetical protein PQX77_021595 [Marasmius sp. AFHP31]|nr:hypothetical protein PQX77_021595 [Marasmius sp. AFHP31]